MDTLAVGINKLTLRAGDILVVHLGWPVADEQVCQLKEQLRDILPTGVTPMVITGDIGLTVLRRGETVEPEPAEVDAPTLVTVPG